MIACNCDIVKSNAAIDILKCTVESVITAELNLVFQCIYGSHGHHIFTTCATCAVVHHSSTPDYNEEVKVALPTQLHDKHHLVFTFYHVSCDLPKVTSSGKGGSRKAHSVESVVGYAWFPLLSNNSRSVH